MHPSEQLIRSIVGYFVETLSIEKTISKFGLIIENYKSEFQRSSDEKILSQILEIVSCVSNISIGEIKSRSRKRHILPARQLYYYYSRKHTIFSLKLIGKYCGYRDHTTVMNGIKKHEDDMSMPIGYLDTSKYIDMNNKVKEKVKQLIND